MSQPLVQHSTTSWGGVILPIYVDTTDTTPGSIAASPPTSTNATFGYYLTDDMCLPLICGQISKLFIISERLDVQVRGSAPGSDPGAAIFVMPMTNKRPFMYMLAYDSPNNPAGAWAYITANLGLGLHQFVKLSVPAQVTFATPSNPSDPRTGEVCTSDTCTIFMNTNMGGVGDTPAVAINVMIPKNVNEFQSIAGSILTSQGISPVS